MLGKWTVLYYYIGDFLPSDATDILELDRAKPRFAAHNADIIAISADSVPTHIAWILALRNQRVDGTDINIELISDNSLSIADILGVTTTDFDMNNNVKTLFIIDEEGILRSIHMYSYNTGINTTELERELVSLQTARYQFGQTPVNWTPGADILSHPPQTINDATTNIIKKEANGGDCLDWYICYKQDTSVRKPPVTTPN